MLAATAQAAQRIDRPGTAQAPPGMPSLEELEAKGATIGRIDVHVQNLFDAADPRENHGIYKLANHLHYRTREQTVRNSLLFSPGEKLVAHRLEETERILRGRVYLNDAWVVPVAYDATTNVVDLAVTVRDVWTLNPGISLGRSGGTNQSKFQIEEENLFGLGTNVQLTHSHNVDRTSDSFDYTDPNLAGSWFQMHLGYADNSDGGEKVFSLVRPFYALDTRMAGGALASESTSIVSRYSLGTIVDQFTAVHNKAEANFGVSRGLIDGWSQRFLVGMRYDETTFNRYFPAPQPAVLPEDRKFVYPWVAWQIIEDRYAKTGNLDLIGRTEDAYVGRSLYAELGYATPKFGAAGQSWLASMNGLAGWQREDREYAFFTGTLVGRLDSGALTNLNINASARYFNRISDRQLFYAALTTQITHRLDEDQQVLLGGDNGLRGYPLRFQGGDASALLTLEHRLYTDWYPFRLFRVGGAVFFDAGRTWGHDLTGAPPIGLLKDVGLGLRFGNVRSGLGNVLHVDFSYALDAPPGIKTVQVTVQTTQRF